MAWKFTSTVHHLHPAHLVLVPLRSNGRLRGAGLWGADRADCNHDFFPFDNSSGLISAPLAQCSCYAFCMSASEQKYRGAGRVTACCNCSNVFAKPPAVQSRTVFVQLRAGHRPVALSISQSTALHPLGIPCSLCCVRVPLGSGSL